MTKTANLKFWHVTVLEGYKTIFQKRCLDIGEANALYQEKKEEYASNKNIVVAKERF